MGSYSAILSVAVEGCIGLTEVLAAGVAACLVVLVWSVAFVPSKEGCRGHHVETATMTPVAGVPAYALIPHKHYRNRFTCGGCSRTIAANIRPFVCTDSTTAYHRTCSGLPRDTDNTIT